jgi:hypothetical protein
LAIYTPFSIFLKKKADPSDLESSLPNGITWDTLPDNYKWKDLCGWDWWIGLGFAFFTLLFILVFFAISTPLSTIIFIWCLVTIFSYVGYKETGEEKEKIYVSNVIGETYGQYKRLMAFIITILVISSVFSNIGTITGITSILVIISIYFGWIPITIFQKFDYTNLDTYKEIKQPIKECLISNKGLDKLKYKQPDDCTLFGNKSILDMDMTPYLTSSKTGDVAKGPDVAKEAPSTNSDTTNSATTNATNATNAAENNRIATLGSEESLNTKPLNTNPLPINLTGGSKNKTLSKYKKKYNVLNY